MICNKLQTSHRQCSFFEGSNFLFLSSTFFSSSLPYFSHIPSSSLSLHLISFLYLSLIFLLFFFSTSSINLSLFPFFSIILPSHPLFLLSIFSIFFFPIILPSLAWPQLGFLLLWQQHANEVVDLSAPLNYSSPLIFLLFFFILMSLSFSRQTSLV